MSKADALISVSEKLRIDVVKRLGLPLRAKVMVGVGKPKPLKGSQRVIPLLPCLRERDPNLIYLIVADLFVLATEYEGWANVFLEAMSCGLPVITTRVGANSEVVPEGIAAQDQHTHHIVAAGVSN